MKKLEFSLTDFNKLALCYDVNQVAADIAQAKFDEWFKQIENAPVVYGICEDLNIPRLAGLEWAFLQSPKDTHTARLVDIQEIKKKCEKHEASYSETRTSMSVDEYDNKYSHVRSVCINCGCELVAEWREK